MEEFMQKILEELFKHMTGRSGKGEEANQSGSPEDSGRMPRIKRACASVLTDMKREIHALGQTIAGLDARRDTLIEDYNALVTEIKAMEAEQHQPRNHAPEEETHDTPAQPEAQPIPETSSRLMLLEQGVVQALAELDEIPNTKRCKELKNLQEHLVKLAEKSDLPEDQRLAELLTGIKQAIAMLNHTKMIKRAKKLQHLRAYLTELLETAGKEEDTIQV